MAGIPVPGRVAEALRRSTVQVNSNGPDGQGQGSAVVLSGQQVITNAHVVRSKALTVESWDGKQVPARLSKVNGRRDLALLSTPGLDAPSATLGDSDLLRAGAPVLAVGNPFGFIGAVSTGIVHAVGPMRFRRGIRASSLAWIQADLRLAPGNSGGPLADLSGKVMGINTMIAAGGVAFAVPSRAVQLFLAQKSSGRGLGITARPVRLDGQTFGMMVLEMTAGSAAEQASLLPGDILLGANGKRFEYVDDLEASIEANSGALLHLEFKRGGQDKLRQVAVQLQEERVMSAA